MVKGALALSATLITLFWALHDVDLATVLTRLAEAERPEDQRLGERLAYTQELLAFASDQLGLEVGGRYSSFVQLDAAYPLWNVFAAPELSVSPHAWCYPLVGCAPLGGEEPQ